MSDKPLKTAKKTLKRVLYTLAAVAAAAFVIAFILLNAMFPIKYSDTVYEESKKYGVDESLIYAVIWTESKFKPKAESAAGARGLMQLLPSTAHWCCDKLDLEYSIEKLDTPDFNIKLGVFYLSYLIEKYDGKEALAAYNAGEGNVQKWDGEIKFKETRDYIKRVELARKIYEFKLK